MCSLMWSSILLVAYTTTSPQSLVKNSRVNMSRIRLPWVLSWHLHLKTVDLVQDMKPLSTWFSHLYRNSIVRLRSNTLEDLHHRLDTQPFRHWAQHCWSPHSMDCSCGHALTVKRNLITPEDVTGSWYTSGGQGFLHHYHSYCVALCESFPSSLWG